MSTNDLVPLWRPNPEGVSRTRIADFLRFLRTRYGVDFGELDYSGLHAWSVAEPARFWEAVARFGEVRFHQLPHTVVEDLDDITRTSWFPGSTLNYAEHVLATRPGHEDDDLAILFEREDGLRESVTYGELRARVAAARTGLVELGVGRGDRVVALAPNCVETVVAFLAAASLGAIWACCSPDFGARAVEDRFEQLAPTVLITVDGYQYNGRMYSLADRVERLRAGLPSLRATVVVPYLDPDATITGTMPWSELTKRTAPLEFEAVPFDHPLWVLYSSGTTGLPKGIVHGHGGIVIEHIKVLHLLSDLRPGDRFFWFTTTGWMMWNYLVGGLLVGATIVCYDGSPAYPGTDRLWAMASEYSIGFFGVSATFLHAAMRAGESPRREHDLGAMRMIGSTGSPLSPDGFGWVAEHVGPDVQIYSNSGGTDVCTPFVMSAPNVPVWVGEISCAALGVAVEAFDPSGRPVIDELGELVVTTPMPSMPVGFWNDEDGARLREAYFEDFPGVWRHGDWVRKTPRGSYIIYGRSDSTLNRGGVRMGTAEFYSVVDSFAGIEDSLVVDVSSPQDDADAPLLCFIVLADGMDEEATVTELRSSLRRELSPRHVPDRFVRISEVPRTLNGKKCEVPVKRILLGASPQSAVSTSALRNPHAIDEFVTRRAEFVGPLTAAMPRDLTHTAQTARPNPSMKGRMTTTEQRGREYVDNLCRRYRRWGKWGADDERGALNFITPEVLVRAAGLVRTGTIVSCALPFDENGPQSGRFGGRHNPIHTMLQDGGDIAIGAQDHMSELRFTDDTITMPLQCGTQWDALAHIFHKGRMYGGHGVEYVTSKGAARNGIEKVADGIAGRGVLLDMPRYFGVDWMQPRQAISSEDLAGAAREQEVEIRSGDVVLIRTGQIAQVRAEGTWGTYEAGDAPGLGVDSAHWIYENEIAAVCADTWGAEVQPNDTDDVFQPLHLILLVNAGIHLGEIFDLEALADVCRTEERYEFLFVAPPLPITGAVGSPVNPLAMF